MLKNNIEVDVKIKCIEAGKTQAQLGEMIGSTGQYVNRIIKKGDGVINKTFVEMLDTASRSSADGCREWGDVPLGRIFAFCRTCR